MEQSGRVVEAESGGNRQGSRIDLGVGFDFGRGGDCYQFGRGVGRLLLANFHAVNLLGYRQQENSSVFSSR